MPSIGWCDNCNVPVLDASDCGICNTRSRILRLSKPELKPIFEEEKKLYEGILSRDFARNSPQVFFPEGMCFYNVMGEVVIEGKKIFRLSIDKKTRNWMIKFFKGSPKEIAELEGSDLKSTIRANQHLLEKKEKESTHFLSKAMKEFKHLPLAISFSGGKDSAVSLALTKLVAERFDVIFLNTTIEFKETVKYVRNLSKFWRFNLIETRPPKTFSELCEQLGPPSTKMKWCCKTQKFSPQNYLINKHYPKGVLVISGIRRLESNIRSKFGRIQQNKMIPRQILAFPILDWSSLDVWLYIMWKKIPINPLYNLGFARIGCWACPEKSLRDFKLIENFQPYLTEKLKEILNNYADHNGIENPKAWIDNGAWRFRKTKWEKIAVCTSSQICSSNEQLVYTINDWSLVNRIKELMKIFGEVKQNKCMMKIRSNDIEISIIGNKMRVNFKKTDIMPIFEKQLMRALNCVGCGACVGICNVNALKIESGKLIVNDKCTKCLRCVTANGIKMSCVSLNYRPKMLYVT